MECEQDISNGRYQFFWQTRSLWGEYMTNIMLDRFNIAVIHTSDITSRDQASFRQGYNERLTEHIDAKYGDGSIKNTLDDVQAYRKKIYDEYCQRNNLNPNGG